MPNLENPEVAAQALLTIASLLGASILTRFLGWIRQVLPVIRYAYLMAEALEMGSQVDAGSLTVKSFLKDCVTAAPEGDAIREAARKLAAYGEKKMNAEGTASKEVQKREESKSRARKVTEAVSRWLPVIGAFL